MVAWLTLVLFAYVAVLFAIKIDWMAAAKRFVLPSFSRWKQLHEYRGYLTRTSTTQMTGALHRILIR